MCGPLTEALLQQTWFGITILSTVATECTWYGVPCFLCGWLDFGPYGYVEHFSRFGVGYLLKSATEVPNIPRILESYSVGPEVANDLWQPIKPDRFEELLSGDGKRHNAVTV